MLGHWFDLLARHGFDRVVVNTHHMAAEVRAFCDGRHPLDVTVTYEPSLLGSAGTLRANRGFVEGAPYFAVGYADTYVHASLMPLIARHERQSPIATIGLFEPPDPHQAGIVTLDERGMVTSFEEKPARPRSTLAFAGVLIGAPGLIDRIPERVPCDLGADILPSLIGVMAGAVVDGLVCDIGTPETYAAVNARMADAR